VRLTAILVLLLVTALAGASVWRRADAYALQQRDAIAEGATLKHPAGTDELGRDRVARMSVALLLGFVGAGIASAVASALALSLGGLAAFAPRWAGRLLLYFGDLFLTLPWLFLLMMVRSALPLTLSAVHSAELTFLLLSVLSVPAFLRLNYTKVGQLKQADWLLQAQAAGLKRRQLVRHFLPHLAPVFVTQFLICIPACLMAEADLGTLGLGVTEPLPSWGSMLGSLQGAALVTDSHLIYLPLLLLVVVLVCLECLVFEAAP
jgi:ABC-type dipeptide/oligopeptide/nickel transport system permease subunit